MLDIGLTHIALSASNIQQSIEFYATYAAMEVVHQRIDQETGIGVVWLSDRTVNSFVTNFGKNPYNFNQTFSANATPLHQKPLKLEIL